MHSSVNPIHGKSIGVLTVLAERCGALTEETPSKISYHDYFHFSPIDATVVTSAFGTRGRMVPPRQGLETSIFDGAPKGDGRACQGHAAP